MDLIAIWINAQGLVLPLPDIRGQVYGASDGPNGSKMSFTVKRSLDFLGHLNLLGGLQEL